MDTRVGSQKTSGAHQLLQYPWHSETFRSRARSAGDMNVSSYDKTGFKWRVDTTMTPHTNRSMNIRPATVSDAGAVSQLAASTFLETFGGENTAVDMARYIAEAFTTEQQA